MIRFALEIKPDENGAISVINEADKSDGMTFSVFVEDIKESRLPEFENHKDTADNDKVPIEICESLSICCESSELEWIAMSANVSIGVGDTCSVVIVSGGCDLTLPDNAKDKRDGEDDEAYSHADSNNVLLLDTNDDLKITDEALTVSDVTNAADITEESIQHRWTK